SPQTADIAQLYCANRYAAVITATGGRLRGVRLSGRRIGDAPFMVRIDVRASAGATSTIVSSETMRNVTAPVLFAFSPVDVAAGEPVTLELAVDGATPISRPLFRYRRSAGATRLTIDGMPVDGVLEGEQIYDGGDDVQ